MLLLAPENDEDEIVDLLGEGGNQNDYSNNVSGISNNNEKSKVGVSKAATAAG
jgi:hypothetical protein